MIILGTKVPASAKTAGAIRLSIRSSTLKYTYIRLPLLCESFEVEVILICNKYVVKISSLPLELSS